MPELPEVESARRLAERACLSKIIKDVIVVEDEKVFPVDTPRTLIGTLKGAKILSVNRLGKHLWFEMDGNRPALLLHFGMTGSLILKGIGAAHYKNFKVDDTVWPPRFSKLELKFDDGTQLSFNDSRRFARVRLQHDPKAHPPLSLLGWDPLLSMPSLHDFCTELSKQKRAIKAVLLDQSFSAGIGNWVADEVCWSARLHPEQPANSLSSEAMEAVYKAIKSVCEHASAVEADDSQFPEDWLFHYRWGKGNKEKSKVLGHPIDHLKVGGRTSAYVPALQKLDKSIVKQRDEDLKSESTKPAATRKHKAKTPAAPPQTARMTRSQRVK